MVMKVFICVAVLVVVIYVISKLSGLYPDNIELSIGSIIRLRIHNKDLKVASTPRDLLSKNLIN